MGLTKQISFFQHSWQQTNVLHKRLPMDGFESRTSVAGSDCSTNWSTTTAIIFYRWNIRASNFSVRIPYLNPPPFLLSDTKTFSASRDDDMCLRGSHLDRSAMELFSRRSWRLVSAQLSIKIWLSTFMSVSIVLWFHKHNSLHLGSYKPSSPVSCRPPRLGYSDTVWPYLATFEKSGGHFLRK